MDARGIALVVLLIFLSGLIAYIGDLVGRRVGKKRVSIFNLRPKHTSIIITICTGIIIVSVTLVGLFLFSDYARKSFFGLQKIIGELSDKKEQLEQTTRKYRREEASLRGEIEKNLRELRDKQAERDDILGKINLKSVELTEMQKSHEKLKEEHAGLKKGKDKMEAEMDRLNEKKEQLEKEIRNAAERLSEVSVETLYGEVLYRKDQLLARVIVTPDIQEDDLRTRLILTINSILSEAVQRGALVDQDSSAIFNQQFKGIREVLRQSEGELIIDTLAANNVFKGQYIYVKFHPIENIIIFARGDAIAQQKVTAGLPREKVEQILLNLLTQVSSIARQKGMIPDPETQRVGSISFPRFNQVLNELSNIKIDKKVSVAAVENTRVSGQLKIDFVVE